MKEINLVNEAQTHPLFCFDARSVHLHVFFFLRCLCFLIYEIHHWRSITLCSKINLVEKNNRHGMERNEKETVTK